MSGTGKHHGADEIIRLLHRACEAQASGKSLGEFCRGIGINPGTLTRWKQQYGAMDLGDAKRLRALEKENQRLKRVVTELELDKIILKEALEGK